MKKSILLLALGLISSLANAGESGTVECQTVNSIHAIHLTASVDATSHLAQPASLKVDFGSQQKPWIATLAPNETEVTLGYRRFNLFSGHHNTVVKIFADGDLFGGEAAAAGQDVKYANFFGRLFLQTGNGDKPTITNKKVSCHLVP